MNFMDEKGSCFICPCKKTKTWCTWKEFRLHRKNTKHPAHCISYVPQCPSCAAIITNTKEHVCVPPFVPSIPPFRECFQCHRHLLVTTLTQSRMWKGNLYCKGCFQEMCVPVMRRNRFFLKAMLLEHAGYLCALCQGKISRDMFSELIFEHMNPFLKSHGSDITPSLWEGKPLSSLWERCRRERVEMVHLICAQIKTLCELEIKDIQDKTWLTKARNRYEISHDMYLAVMTRKAHKYEEVTLPKIKKIICEHNTSHPFRADRVRKRRRHSR